MTYRSPIMFAGLLLSQFATEAISELEAAQAKAPREPKPGQDPAHDSVVERIRQERLARKRASHARRYPNG